MRLQVRACASDLAAMRGEFVDLGGKRLYYYAAGTRGVGEPLAFLHGFPGSSHLWHRVVPLMPGGNRIVVLDLLGAGRSDATKRPSDLSALSHAARLRAFFDELGMERACLVGHGSGGAVAQAFALECPARVTHLGLVNSTAFDAWLGAPTRIARAAGGVLDGIASLTETLLTSERDEPDHEEIMEASFQPLGWLVERAFRRGYFDPAMGAASLAQYVRAYTRPPERGLLLAQLRAARDPDVPAMGARLGTLRVPTSIIWGGADPFLPASVGERLTGAIRGASLEVIPHARHFSPEDAPKEVARAIDQLLRR